MPSEKQLAEWIYEALKQSSAFPQYGCSGYFSPLELDGGTTVDGEIDFMAVAKIVNDRLKNDQ